MSRHTPIPWNLSSKGDGRIYIEGGETAEDIAVTLMGHDQQEDAANARVLVAAPYLLAALLELQFSAPGGRCPRCLAEGTRERGGHDTSCIVGVAIAKATGGAA